MSITSFEQYLDSIAKPEHRDYADLLIQGSLPVYRERVAAKQAEVEASGVVSYWQMFLGRPEVGPGTPFPKVSWEVGEVLADDIKFLEDHGSLFSSRYARHLAKQARRAEARRKTIQRRGGFARPRDSQRQRLYDAERAGLDSLAQVSWGERSVPEMQAWVDKILASAWWKRRYPGVRKVTVKDGAGHRSAYAKTSWPEGLIIEIPLWARKDWVLLHELAHHATDSNHSDIAAHGREFARVYVELVNHIMGKAAGAALKAAFRQHRVKFSKPRVMTEDQKRAAADRLAVARAARPPT